MTEQDLLPISTDILETDEEERADDAMRGDFIFEPEPEEILERLLRSTSRRSSTARCSSRPRRSRGAMTAMRNASKNAAELITG